MSYGRVPAGSVVVSGNLPKDGGRYSLYCAVIVKKVDAKTRATVGEIWALYVAPEHWRQGVGLALWDGARDGLKDEGCTQVTLWVLLQNERALEFFEHAAGFKRDMTTLKSVDFGTAKLEEIRLKRAVD